MVASESRHVLIVNQHGDNRGDEAALDAMLHGIESRLGAVQFTVIHQMRNAASVRTMRPDVELITLRLPVTEAVRLVLFLVFRVLGIKMKFLLGPIGRQTISAYESADVVVSAPGGPYFGDIYINHEFVHWLYVWMAALHHKPSVLYATSAGPFNKKWANPFRRFTYRQFHSVLVREEISAKHIRDLFGSRSKNVAVQVTVDSALQRSVQPIDRNTSRSLIVVSAINWAYKGDPNPEQRKKEYDELVAFAAVRLAEGNPCDVLLVPQLHDTLHRDAPYLEKLADVIRRQSNGAGILVSVLDENQDMLTQRSYFAAANWVIAGRYHPAVFSISAGVPQLCIAYEHKAIGLLHLAGLHDIVLPIEEASTERVTQIVEHLLSNRTDIAQRSAAAATKLQKLSELTSDAVVTALKSGSV
jgi:polysaccharide pyruvyl transferase WcaK-like protein